LYSATLLANAIELDELLEEERQAGLQAADDDVELPAA